MKQLGECGLEDENCFAHTKFEVDDKIQYVNGWTRKDVGGLHADK
jgi:hypothetical protein